MTPTAPQAAHPRALAFLVGVVLLDTIGFGIVIPVMPALIVELSGADLGHAAVLGGWLFFSFAAVQLFAAPLLGNLSDRYGRRPVLLLSLLMFGVDYLLMGLAPSLAWLFLGRILAGIPGASYTTAYAYLADITPPAARAARFGLIGAAFGVGFILGPALGGLLASFGPRAPFLAAAALAFANLAFGFLALPESLPPERRRAFAWRRASPLGALGHLRRHPQALAVAGVLFLWALGTQAYPTVWSFYTMLKFGWTEAAVGASLAFAGAIMVISQGGLTRVAVPRLGEGRAALVGLGAGALAFAGYAFASQGWMMYAGLLTWLLAGLAMPSLNALLSKRVPADAQGELQGANASILSLTAILGPLLMTQLFGAFSGPAAPVAFPGAAFLAAALLAGAGAALLARALRQPGAPVPDGGRDATAGGPPPAPGADAASGARDGAA